MSEKPTSKPKTSSTQKSMNYLPIVNQDKINYLVKVLQSFTLNQEDKEKLDNFHLSFKESRKKALKQSKEKKKNKESGSSEAAKSREQAEKPKAGNFQY